MQRAQSSDGSSGRRASTPAAPHADPHGHRSDSPDNPLRTFPIQALHAPSPAGSCSEDGDISCPTQPPNPVACMDHQAEGPPVDDAPLPHPPFKLLTPVQRLEQSWKETGRTSHRLGRARALLSHSISSGVGSVDGGQCKGAGCEAATASQTSRPLDVVGASPAAVLSSFDLVHETVNGSCPAPCIRHGSVGELESDADKAAYSSALYRPSQDTSTGKGGACTNRLELQRNSPSARQPCTKKDAAGAAWGSVGWDTTATLDAGSSEASSPLHVYTGTFTSTGDFVLDDDS